MFGSQTRQAAQVSSSARGEAKEGKPADLTEKKQLKPTEPVWKTTEALRSVAPPFPAPEAEPQANSRETAADVRTLIIGPGVSVKGEITSCNRLIVEGKIEAKLADCPNVIIKEEASLTGKARLRMLRYRVRSTVTSLFEGVCSSRRRVGSLARSPMATSRSNAAAKSPGRSATRRFRV